MTFKKQPIRIESKTKNNTFLNNYDSSNILNQYYKLFSKDNNKSNNIMDGDLSSIQLSESNNDRDIRFVFGKKNVSEKKVRRSHQLDYQKLIKFRLKDENKRKFPVRNSMFNPKNTVIISPIHRIVSQQGGGNVSNNNISNLLSSNGDFGNNEDIKFFDTFNNSNNNYLKNGTLIDNRDKKNNNMIDNSLQKI
jgi:hypothetical protein